MLSKAVQGIRLDKPGIYFSESCFSIGFKVVLSLNGDKKTAQNVLKQRHELLIVDRHSLPVLGGAEIHSVSIWAVSSEMVNSIYLVI